MHIHWAYIDAAMVSYVTKTVMIIIAFFQYVKLIYSLIFSALRAVKDDPHGQITCEIDKAVFETGRYK